MDLLISPRNRFMYTVLFGIMGISLVNGFNTIDSTLTNLPGRNNIYLSTFNKMCKASPQAIALYNVALVVSEHSL